MSTPVPTSHFTWSRSRTVGVGVTAALLLLWWWRRRQSKKDALVLTGTRASATGKVLITGGYLVLDRAHTGLVLSVSARFHSTVIPITPHVAHRLHTSGITLSSIQPQHATQPQQHRYTTTFIVYAPQRSTTASIYNLTYTSGGHFQCTLSQGEQNPFIEHTLEITLSLIMTLIEEKIVVDMLKNGILLYLKGDAPFYTSEKESYDQSNGIFTSPLPPDSKTGLGSSAALVASLVAALFTHFGLSPTVTTSTSTRTFQALTNTTDTHDTQVHLRSSLQLRDQDIIHIAHACAQLCHCIAQGKIGSGFDISTAFYGNQQYRRFTAQHIQPLIDRVESKQYIPAGLLLRYLLPSSTLRDVTLSSPTKQDAVIWDHTVTSLVLPPGLILVLGDVHGGSKTPGMVKQVLSWRDTHPESESIWNALAAANQSVEQGLRTLYHASAQDRSQYDEILATCAKLPAKEWSTLTSPIAAHLFNLHTSFQQVRSHLVTMGNACGVEIEPTKQTQILNATNDVAGVLFAGVPGAGGSDAIFTIVLSPTVIPQVERVWAKSSDVKIRRLPVEQDTIPGVIVSKPTLEVDRWSLFRV